MSTLVFMQILESSPSRYDRGMQIITFGKLIPLYQKLTSSIQAGQDVLDIGCGTGLLSLLAAEQGAIVKGIDINLEMLELARSRIDKTEYKEKVTLAEMGIAELDTEDDAGYDIVITGLIFSELAEYEQEYTLKHIHRILKPGGKLIFVDEIPAKNPIKRVIQWLLKFPLVIITYLLTQTTTKAVKNIENRLVNHGFEIEDEGYSMLSSLKYIMARRCKD